MAPEIKLRSPSSHTYTGTQANGSKDVKGPTYDWIAGSWYVSYTSLPLWSDKQNVRISYNRLPSSNVDSDKMPDLDDHVESQKVGKTKVDHIHGVSKPVHVEGVEDGLAYSWRGKGLMLSFITSDWEILGHGADTESSEPNDWIVTFFCKTLFTPVGMDIYTRTKASLSEATLTAIKAELEKISDDGFTAIAKAIYEVPRV
jgi:hypothetical protein